MSLQSLAEALGPLVDASATQPRNKPHSAFSPLVGWLDTWWSSEDCETATTDRFLVPDPDLFISPIINYNFPEPSTHTPLPALRATNTPGIALQDEVCEDGVSEMRRPLRQSHKAGLTKEEFDYVVNSLLKFLEDAEAASRESGCDGCECECECECIAPVNADHGLSHDLWSPGSHLYLMHDNEDDDSLSVAETLELDEADRRGSLELVRTSARVVPIHAKLLQVDERYPYRFGLKFEGERSDSE